MAVWRGLAKPARYAVLAAGALVAMAYPAPNLEYLAWFGLVPGLLIIQRAPAAREAAVRGWWFGAGFLLAALSWLMPAIGPGLLLVAAVLGLLWTGVAVAAWSLLRPPLTMRRALAALVVLPSYWLLIEWTRSWQGFAGPWSVLGASQWQHPAVLALAAVGGVWLVSFAIVAANTGILILLAAGRTAVRLAGAAAAVLAIAAGPVVFALTPAAAVRGHVTLALVQPGTVRGPAARADSSQRLTMGLGRVRPDLIVWGESSVGVNVRSDPRLLSRIEALSAASGAAILVNQDAARGHGEVSKVAVLVGPGGIIGTYIKSRLVPFGEYIPYRPVLGWLSRISRAASANRVPGDGAHLIHATDRAGRPLPLGVLICFESAFPDMSRVDADLGGRLIIYQTSDSTFQHSWAPAQHASLGAVRAAETGRPVAQAALTGDTVAYDARGRLLGTLPAGRHGVVVVRLGLSPAGFRTPYDQLGDYVPWTSVGIAALAGALALGRAARMGRLRHIQPHLGARIMWDSNHRRMKSVSIAGSPPQQAGKPWPAGTDDDAAAPWPGVNSDLRRSGKPGDEQTRTTTDPRRRRHAGSRADRLARRRGRG